MRPNARARGYTRRWERLRKVQLARAPLCEYCEQQGRTVPAQVVDHIIPHRGDHALLYDLDNLQSLCETCHNAVKQAEEKGGHVRGAGVDGTPLDPGHHWR